MVVHERPLLRDPVLSVRVEAARALAGVDPQMLTPEQRGAFGIALLELTVDEMTSADRPEAHLNLGLLQMRRGQSDAAENQYRTALRLDPNFVPAMVNLADLHRAPDSNLQGLELLHRALQIEPNNADVHHALGLLLVRQRQYAEALPELRRASELAPDNPRCAYVYAVALNSTGAPTEALTLLERAHERFPADRDVLLLLVSIARGRGNIATALRHARELATLDPTDVQLALLIRDLEKAQAE